MNRIIIKTALIFLFTFSNVFSQTAWKDLFVSSQNLLKSGKTDLALEESQKALQQAESEYGRNSEYYSATIALQGEIYFRKNDFTKAIQLFKKDRDLKKKILGDSHPNYAKTLNNLSTVYTNLGKYTEAEPILREALSIKIKAKGENDTSTALSFQNLGVMCQRIGKFAEAEKLLIKAAEIRKTLLGEQNIQYANTLVSLGMLYNMLGNNENASNYLEKAVGILRNTLGDSNSVTSNAEFQLVKCYLESNNQAKAKPLLEKVQAVQKKIVSQKNPQLIETLMSLGQVKWAEGKYSEAKDIYYQAMELVEKFYGNGHPYYAKCLYSIATLDTRLGKYDNALKSMTQAIKITEKIFGEDYPEFATMIHTYAGLLQNMNKFDEAEKNYRKCFDIYKKQIKNYFPFLSESEKSKFYFNLKKRFDMFNCYVLQRQKENPSLISEMLDNRITTKGLLLNSSLKIKNKILSSENESLINKYNTWKLLKEEISDLYHLSKSEILAKGKNIDSLENLCNKMEKEISIESSAFKSEITERSSDWHKVCESLGSNEAAVEIIRFNWQSSVVTDTVFYVALILKNETKDVPEMVVLKNGQELEQKFIKNYLNSIQFKIPDMDSWKVFWEPIDKALGDKEVIFTSLDGVYNKINLSALQKQDNSFLIDKRSIVNVTNIMDIANHKKNSKPFQSKTASLFGNPKYKLDKQTDETENSFQGDIPQINMEVSDLPGTQIEIDGINSVMKKGKWTSQVYSGIEASKSNFSSIKSIGVLHLATHGFFMPDVKMKQQDKILGINAEKAQENPFLRSGLLFSGAHNSINNINGGTQSKQGILTAYEAMGLDLDDVNLLVLSACETGLGEIKNGEGVFGLQRAFQIAGAKTIIMSLWKVNDQTTQELMTEFYKLLLSGKKIHEAFRDAQLSIKAKYQHPYFWGGFVLIGAFE